MWGYARSILPYITVEMAFQTTQTIDAVLLNNLLFRNTANTPISSFYTLYANGKGQTFWAPSVQPDNISSLSTALSQQTSTLSSGIFELQSSFTIFSTTTVPSSFSSLTASVNSTFAQLNTSYSILNVQFANLSNNLTNDFTILSNTLTSQVNLTTSTTIGVVTSTISGISSISSYTGEFLATQQFVSAAASTLSTAIYLEGQATVSTLSSINDAAKTECLSTSIGYTDTLFSTLSSFLVTSTLINELSTQQGYSLLGATSTLGYEISSGIWLLSSQFYEFSQSSISTQTWIVSTLAGVSASLTPLLNLSSQISTIIYNDISTFTAPIFQQQDVKFSQYTSTLLNDISSLSSSVYLSNQEIEFISTITSQSVSTITATNQIIFSEISTLDRSFSILTTSSILVDIYDSFYDLSTYTSLLIQSTVNTMIPFRSTVFYSTSVQNMSTGAGYYANYVSSVYASTLSTMIPITNIYVSSLISSLYSTGTFALLSSIDSTILGKSNEFQSTNSSLTSALLLSSITQFNSSIQGYLSTPSAVQLSTFSSIGAAAISTYQGQGLSTLRAQSTLFGISFSQNQSSFSTQNSIGSGIVSTLSTSFVQYSSTFTGLFQSIQTSSISQLTSQNAQFISSMNSYQSQFNSTLVSTNASIVIQTNSTANRVLSSIITSTNTAYTAFVNSFAAYNVSTVGLSTLFTNQTITLSGSNFQGTMDFGGFTNFTINVRAPLISGSSNYRINYNSNQISNLNYRRGFITVDVSTVTTGYSNNNGRLCLDTYRWGLPTTIYNEFYPSISSCDYTTVYSYTILNNIVYTNLLNVFPRLRVNALNITTATNTGVANSYWRGSPLNVSWSNYSFFPIQAIGAPAYAAEVLVDVGYSNIVQSQFGPYPLTVSSATIRLPYITGSTANLISTFIRTYIVGKPLEAEERVVNMIMPQLYSVEIASPAGKFLALNEVSAFSDTGNNTFSGLSASQIESINSSAPPFGGTINSYFATVYRNFAGSSDITINSDPDFALPGDFTIEWFQYMAGGSSATTRPVFGTASNEIQFTWAGNTSTNTPTLNFGGTTYTWANRGAAINNIWVHVAISRQGSTLRLFVNGVADATTYTDSTSITNTANLVLGKIGGNGIIAVMSNFRWIKGVAIYTTNFAVPTTALSVTAQTRFLLNAYSSTPVDQSGTGKTVTQTSITTIINNDLFTGYSKLSLIDGNPSTFFASASYQDTPATNNKVTFIPNLALTNTNISSILVQNISSTNSFLRSYNPAINDSQELQGATMTIRSLVGATFYQSTITLTSSITQQFFI